MKKLGFLVGTTSTSLCCCCMASGSAQIQNLSLDAEKVFSGKQKTDLIELKWQGNSASSVKYLKQVRITGGAWNKLASLTLTIPGEVDGKQVIVSNEAFQNLESLTVRLHLVFKERNGKKVRLPQSCTAMFRNSSAIHSFDFSGIDTSGTNTMQEMFWGCKSISTLDLRHFSTKRLEAGDLERMLVGCTGLKLLNVSSFKPELKTDEALYYMFTNRYDSPGYVEGMYDYFKEKSGLKVIADSFLKNSEKKRSEGYTRDDDSIYEDGMDFGDRSTTNNSALKVTNTPERKATKYRESEIKEDSMMRSEPRSKPRFLNLEKQLIYDDCEDEVEEKDDANEDVNKLTKVVQDGVDTSQRKYNKQVPMQLPTMSINGAKFTKQTVLEPEVIRNPNKSVNRCYFSKQCHKAPVKLPRVSDAAARITKKPGIIVTTPAIKLPIAAQDGHFVSKRYDKVPVQLPKASAEGATITKTNKIVNVTPAMKVQNKDINRCYFSKQTVNKEATDIKNTLERNENMAQVNEEVTKGKKRHIKPVMGTSQQAKHKITWYSCIVKVWKDFVSAWKRLASRVVSSFK